MSPGTAKALHPGSYVARRGTQDTRRFTHVATVVKTTSLAFWISFAPGDAKSIRIAYTNLPMLRTLRTADSAETQGYARALA